MGSDFFTINCHMQHVAPAAAALFLSNCIAAHKRARFFFAAACVSRVHGEFSNRATRR